MYESSPPTVRTTDHEARTTPGIHPKNSRVLTLTAGVEEEDDEEEEDVRTLLGEYTVGNTRRNTS